MVCTAWRYYLKAPHGWRPTSEKVNEVTEVCWQPRSRARESNVRRTKSIQNELFSLSTGENHSGPENRWTNIEDAETIFRMFEFIFWIHFIFHFIQQCSKFKLWIIRLICSDSVTVTHFVFASNANKPIVERSSMRLRDGRSEDYQRGNIKRRLPIGDYQAKTTKQRLSIEESQAILNSLEQKELRAISEHWKRTCFKSAHRDHISIFRANIHGEYSGRILNVDLCRCPAIGPSLPCDFRASSLKILPSIGKQFERLITILF